MANRKHSNVDVSAFRGGVPGYLGDELTPDRYANDKVHLLGRADDHILDCHRPPVIIRGWQVEEDTSTPGGYKLLPGAGILLDAAGEPVRVETIANITGILPVDTTPGTANYITVVDATTLSAAESSRYDSHTYAKDITPGAAVNVAPSYDPDADILVGVLYPVADPGTPTNHLMTQPWRTMDMGGVTRGTDWGAVNYIPNTDLTCTSAQSSPVMQPDWWEWSGLTPDTCTPVTLGALPDLTRLDVKLSTGQGLELRLPDTVAGTLNRYSQFVLSFGVKAHADPGTAPLIIELYSLTVSWSLVGSVELHPQYLTGHSQIGLALQPGGGSLGYKVVVRNPSTGWCRFYLAEPNLTRGTGMALPMPSSMRRDMVWRYGFSGAAIVGGDLAAAGLAGDYFQLTESALLTRVWVHAGTAASGGDHTITINVDGMPVTTVTLGDGETDVAKYINTGGAVWPAGSRIGVHISGISFPDTAAADIAVSVGIA